MARSAATSATCWATFHSAHSPRCWAVTARRSATRHKSLGGHQYLGGPARVRPGDQEPDHVQVTLDREYANGKGTGRRAYSRLHARSIGAHLHPAARLA